MTKHITITLTEDQAIELHFQLEMLGARLKGTSLDDKSMYFIERIASKIAHQLNS